MLFWNEAVADSWFAPALPVERRKHVRCFERLLLAFKASERLPPLRNPLPNATVVGAVFCFLEAAAAAPLLLSETELVIDEVREDSSELFRFRAKPF